nr:MAG TPA: CpcD/allophycocyanin linker domain [Caudoviricetes sp.]
MSQTMRQTKRLQSYILSITEAHTIAGIHTKRASKHPCM